MAEKQTNVTVTFKGSRGGNDPGGNDPGGNDPGGIGRSGARARGGLAIEREGSGNPAPGEAAYFKVRPDETNLGYPVNVSASQGTVALKSRNVLYDSSETLKFENSDEARLSYYSEVPEFTELEWIGQSLAENPLISGDRVTIPNPGVGIASVTYKHYAHRYKLVATPELEPGETEEVLVTATQGEATASATVTYEQPEEDNGDEDGGGGDEDDGGDDGEETIAVVVKDYCTGETLSGVSVSIDGKYLGATDSNGRLSLGSLSSGTHTISMSKAGYVSSGSDVLANDSFTV